MEVRKFSEDRGREAFTDTRNGNQQFALASKSRIASNERSDLRFNLIDPPIKKGQRRLDPRLLASPTWPTTAVSRVISPARAFARRTAPGRRRRSPPWRRTFPVARPFCFREASLIGYVVRLALILGAAALFADCGGSSSPIGAPGAMSQSRALAQHADRGGSWMLPEAKNKDLLYVATGGDVYVLSYPSGKVVGRLGVESASSLCSDEAGDVFVVQDGTDAEYTHRGKLVQTLTTYDVPQSCSVDPTTGNLAVPTVDYSCVYINPGRGRRHSPCATILS